jgi:hypothetical protein
MLFMILFENGISSSQLTVDPITLPLLILPFAPD